MYVRTLCLQESTDKANDRETIDGSPKHYTFALYVPTGIFAGEDLFAETHIFEFDIHRNWRLYIYSLVLIGDRHNWKTAYVVPLVETLATRP